MPTLIRDKATKIWKVRDRRGGRDSLSSLGTTEKAQAEARFAKWLLAHDGDRWKEIDHTFEEAVEKLRDEHLPNLRPNSVRTYAAHLRALSPHFERRKLSEIGRAELYAYEQVRRKAGVRPSTVLAELKVLSVICECAAESEWLETNPVGSYLRTRKKKGLVPSPPQTRYLSEDEEERLLKAALRRPDPDMVTAAIALTIDTGLRAEELFGLTREHVDLARKEIVVTAARAKSKKERRVPLLPRAERTLRMLEDMPWFGAYVIRQRDGRRYEHLRAIIRRLARDARIPPLRWHDLRRTCGCRLLQAHGLPMHAVSMWLGHSSVVQTEKAYAFLRIDDLHRAVGTKRGEETTWPRSD